MLLDADTILRAKKGAPYEIQYLQEYFNDYINALSVVFATEPDGRVVPYLNLEIKEELRACVIEATLKFDIHKGKKIHGKNLLIEEKHAKDVNLST